MQNKKNILAHFRRCLSILYEVRSSFFDMGTASFVTVLVIAFSSFVVGLAFLFYVNIQKVMDSWRNNICVSVLLSCESTSVEISTFKKKLYGIEGVKRVVFHSPEESLNDFNQLFSEYSGVFLEKMKKNPFPPVLDVFVTSDFLAIDRIEDIVRLVKKDKIVSAAFYDRFILKRFQGLIKLGKIIIYTLIFLVGFPSAILISNTVRLSIMSRRDEIELLRIFGATEGFIFYPFLLGALFYGFLGCVLAIILLWINHRMFLQGLMRTLNIIGNTILDYSYSFLTFTEIFEVFAFISFLCIFGGFLGIKRGVGLPR